MDDAEDVSAGDVDDDVAPGEGQGDDGEEAEEDEDDDVVGLVLGPEEQVVDIVPPEVHGADQEGGEEAAGQEVKEGAAPGVVEPQPGTQGLL